MTHPHLLRPDRLRIIERPFAWLPCRLLQNDLLKKMTAPPKRLYMRLALAADRNGLSYWGERRICEMLGISTAELLQARDQLIQFDWLAFEERVYQLLSLPYCEPASDIPVQHPQPPVSPTTLACNTEPSDPYQDTIPEQARLMISKILGRKFLR